jgi:hypothetical protein
MRRTIEITIALMLVAGCSAQLECVHPSASCQPLYDPPTFQALYDNILHPTCASGSGTCHTSDARMGGLVFEDEMSAYNLLLGMVDGRARVLPQNPGCSILLERLYASDPQLRMPPGSHPLSAPELCTFVQWITRGANP